MTIILYLNGIGYQPPAVAGRSEVRNAVALPGVVLPAGSYTFDTADSKALDVVVVRSRANNKVLYMGFTTQVRRPWGMSPNTAVTLGEASGNEALPITAWYEIGRSMGHQFRY